MPDFQDYAVEVSKPGYGQGRSDPRLGDFLRDVMKLNSERENFRVFGPDETASNRLDALFEVTGPRVGWREILPNDEHVVHATDA